MLFYCFFISALILFFADYNINGIRKPKIITSFGIIFFTSVLIFRFDIGYDYPTYYKMLYPTFQADWIADQEPIYQLICNIIYYLHLPPVSLFIIIGTLTCLFMFKTFLKYTDSILLAVLTYLAFYFETSFGFIRQGLALSIILFGYPYLVNKQWGKYFVICIIAGLAHYSAFVCLMFPLLYKYTSSFMRMMFFIVILVLLYKVVLQWVVNYLGLYENAFNGDNEITGGRLMKYRNILFLGGLYLFAYLGGNNDAYKRLIRIGLIGCVFPFLLGGHFGGRIVWYFMIYMCIVLPNVIMHYKQRLIHCLWAMGVIAIFFITIYVSMGIAAKSPYTPYQTIFTADLDNPVFK